jgi:hypothetical protein
VLIYISLASEKGWGEIKKIFDMKREGDASKRVRVQVNERRGCSSEQS